MAIIESRLRAVTVLDITIAGLNFYCYICSLTARFCTSPIRTYVRRLPLHSPAMSGKHSRKLYSYD